MERRAYLPGSTLLLVVLLIVSGCSGTDTASDDTQAPVSSVTTGTTITVGTTVPGVSSSTTGVASTSTVPADLDVAGEEGFVVFLGELRSMANYYFPYWKDYESPLFALWPDGWVMVREKGGYSSPALYLEAKLDEAEIEEIRAWVAEAELDTLEPLYPLPERGGLDSTAPTVRITDLPLWRLVVRDGTASFEVTFEPGYPNADDTYPVQLQTLVDRLQGYRHDTLVPFAPREIEVIVAERAPYPPGRLTSLPDLYDLGQMKEIFRSIEEVHYQKIVWGEEAEEIMRRVDAGENLYTDERRSYRVLYRPIVRWPLDPTLLLSVVGTTQTSYD